jgi:hypothetical protein
MTCEKANSLSIVQFLDSLGMQPAKISGHVYWYLSPFRQEKTASFKVDTGLNRWYDHGISQGGKLVDLGVLVGQCTVAEFLKRLATRDLASLSFHKRAVHEPSAIKISELKSLGNPALLSYLNERSISMDEASRFCKEAYYSVDNRNYFAIAFENDSHGFEIRNRYFKACLGVKDITTIINPGTDRVALFEGFTDFLSGLNQLQLKMSQSSFIVLNSVNQIDKAKRKLFELAPKNIDAYFDNDTGGKACFRSLQADFPQARDHSSLYRSYKDINEMANAKKKLDRGISR